MRLHLVIDADDTLWENNIYFEHAFKEFVDYLDHSTLSASEIRAVLDEIELANNRLYGYGSANFAGERLLDHPTEVIDGVKETLDYLGSRHDLLLFTKGHPEEQKLKLDRSGLGRHFGYTAIVKEKDAPAYAALVSERGLDPERTWMIGNSPKSDVNPALEAGLNAVFIPHAHTWTLEREEIRSANGRLLVLSSFRELTSYF
jgi:putative hydrolase of the HAD superfamily